MKLTALVRWLVLPSTLGFASYAHADCDQVWAAAQTAKQEARLLAARAQYQSCINVCTNGTPGQNAALRDCAETLKQLEKDIPSVVPEAVDGNGAAIVDVAVSVDGRPLVSALDGRAIELDPGRHAFSFRWRDTSQTIPFTVEQGRQNQPVRATFGTPAPAPLAAQPLARTDTIQLVPGVRQVAFSSEDANEWELANSDGRPICTLPCLASVFPDEGYQIRGPAGRTTFSGSSATTSHATVSPPRGSKSLAGITLIASVIVGASGAVVYFAGNGQSAKQGLGIGLGVAGGVGLLAGGIWWFASSSEPRVNFGQSNSGQAKRWRVGLLLTPNQWGVTSRW